MCQSWCPRYERCNRSCRKPKSVLEQREHEQRDRGLLSAVYDMGSSLYPVNHDPTVRGLDTNRPATYDTDLCRADIAIVRTKAPVFWLPRPRHGPHPQRMISTPRDDQRSLWPPLLYNDPSPLLDIDPLWLHNRKASHRAGMASKHMGTPTRIEVPDPDCAVGRATNEGVFARGKRPHSPFVTLQKAYELASEWGV